MQNALSAVSQLVHLGDLYEDHQIGTSGTVLKGIETWKASVSLPNYKWPCHIKWCVQCAGSSNWPTEKFQGAQQFQGQPQPYNIPQRKPTISCHLDWLPSWLYSSRIHHHHAKGQNPNTIGKAGLWHLALKTFSESHQRTPMIYGHNMTAISFHSWWSRNAFTARVAASLVCAKLSLSASLQRAASVSASCLTRKVPYPKRSNEKQWEHFIEWLVHFAWPRCILTQFRGQITARMPLQII